MFTHAKLKSSFDEFFERRGIKRDEFHLNEKSLLLQKIINMKRNTKNINSANTSISYDYIEATPKKKLFQNKLIKKSNKFDLFNDEDKINLMKNNIYNNYISNFGNNSNKDKVIKVSKDNKIKENKRNNLSINCNYFSDEFKKGSQKNDKNNIFNTSSKPLDTSKEIILNRINRINNKRNNYNNNIINNSNKNKFFKTFHKPTTNKFKNIINNSNNKFIYKKKIQNDIYKKKTKFSRNKTSLYFTAHNSRENSICTSIDFSIINRASAHDKNYSLSKTSENFFILSTNKKNKKKFENKNQLHSRNIKFINHFIKYCYLYYIIVIKKFFNNLKQLKNDIYSNISNLISGNKNHNLFYEFNYEDFDRETIKNKTSDNFYDGINLSFISANKNKNNKKNLVYNRYQRIFKQNYQKKNLIELLNNSYIETDKNIQNYENQRFTFDNEKECENENNNETKSPFFNGKNAQNNISENNKNNLSKKEFQSKNSDNKDNIIGFIQINNEINPFKIKNNNINFFNESSPNYQSNEDEILSFRKKNSAKNNNKLNQIINIFNIKSKDNKLNIDIKYFSNSNFKKYSYKFNNNELIIDNFYLKICDNMFINKRIKKISLRVKNSRLIKEKEEDVDLNNKENRKKYLYSLSIIKEEDDEKNINDSSLQRSNPFKKLEPYYNISNNSKLISKSSIEKLIDGDKIINEEDLDKVLNKSSSRYKGYNHYNKKSQEIMVVSNFNSIMRNRIHRKENAKSLINGILILIKFFGSLSFNIRKKIFIKFKMYWKLCKFMIHVIKYAYKIFMKKLERN